MDKPVFCPKCAHQFTHDYAPAFVPNVPFSYVTLFGYRQEGERTISHWSFRCGWCETEGEITVAGT